VLANIPTYVLLSLALFGFSDLTSYLVTFLRHCNATPLISDMQSLITIQKQN